MPPTADRERAIVKTKSKAKSIWIWASALTFSGSYLLAVALERTSLAEKMPGIVTALAVAVAAALGSRSKRLLHGAGRGAAAGLAGGLAIVMSLLGRGEMVALNRLGVPMASTVLLATVTGTLFAALARRRRQMP